MNRINKFLLASAIFVLCGTMTVFAAQDEKNGHAYFTQAELPDMTNFLPAPPDFETARFVADETQYLWGIRQRQDPERTAMAIRDADYGMQTIIQEYCPILGLEITKEGTPELYTLMQDVGATCDSISDRAKKFYKRTRPFVYYNQPTLVPEQEESHRTNGSYPSGHTVLGWTMALLLSDINPAVAEELLARGYEYGQSRVIAGYHWQSDVDAGRLAASVLYAKLQGNERFREQLAKAQQEFKEQTGGASHVKENTIVAPVGTSRAYTITGVPATSETRGIIIQNGQKIYRP
ncbi:MAG: phosphatase PAP2 family protein [Muribaculaceae bacterium]|nr:phosphatase PAP2 family protein [Muribaculaceae bacterium]